MQVHESQVRDDRRNRDFLYRSSFNSIFGSMNSNLRDLIDHGSPEQCAQAVSDVKRRYKRIFAAIVLLALWWALTPSTLRVDPPSPIITPAGTVSAIQLNTSSFSTTTSLTTTGGIYQVAGAVSGQIGDYVDVKVETIFGREVTTVCVESKVKPNCYSLL